MPGKYHTWANANLCTLTCSTFFRRSLLEKHDLYFDSKLKDVGDADWIIRALTKNIPMAVLPDFTSAFTKTGANMNLLPNARRESVVLANSAPAWARLLRPALKTGFRLRKFLQGGYNQKPFTYAIYTVDSPEKRVAFSVARPTQKWPE